MIISGAKQLQKSRAKEKAPRDQTSEERISLRGSLVRLRSTIRLKVNVVPGNGTCEVNGARRADNHRLLKFLFLELPEDRANWAALHI